MASLHFKNNDHFTKTGSGKAALIKCGMAFFLQDATAPRGAGE
jgi:hypothetical protein